MKGKQIPGEFRAKVYARIHSTIKPYAKANGEWQECCDAAAALKMTPQSVYNWYNGLCLPTMYNLVRFADLYEVSIDYLFGRLNKQSILEIRQAINELDRVKA